MYKQKNEFCHRKHFPLKLYDLHQYLSAAEYTFGQAIEATTFKEYMSDSFTNYNYVGNTKVSVSIKKNVCQQMHIKRDISN